MKWGTTAVLLGILALVAGCGTSTTYHGKVVPGTGPGIDDAPELSWQGTVYLGSQSISQVVGQIGKVEEEVQRINIDTKSAKTLSNFAPVGTKIYSVPGTITSKAIAIEQPKGHFQEFLAMSTFQH